MFLKRYIKYFWLIILIIAVSSLYGCGGAKAVKTSPKNKKMEIANKKGKGETKKEKSLEIKKQEKKKKKISKKKEQEKKEITIGKTTKAYLIAHYGKPDKLFWSKEAEEILIYNKIKKMGKNVIIFINNKGVVKHITTFSKK